MFKVWVLKGHFFPVFWVEKRVLTFSEKNGFFRPSWTQIFLFWKIDLFLKSLLIAEIWIFIKKRRMQVLGVFPSMQFRPIVEKNLSCDWFSHHKFWASVASWVLHWQETAKTLFIKARILNVSNLLMMIYKSLSFVSKRSTLEKLGAVNQNALLDYQNYNARQT